MTIPPTSRPISPGMRNRSITSGPTSTTAAAINNCHSVPCGEVSLSRSIEPPSASFLGDDDGDVVRVDGEDRIQPGRAQPVDRAVREQARERLVDDLEILGARRQDPDDLLEVVEPGGDGQAVLAGDCQRG